MILIAVFALSVLILALGTWVGAKIFSKDVPFLNCAIAAVITAAVGVFVPFGGILSTIVFFICLVTIVQLDFWPEAVVVWFVVKLINIGLSFAIMGALR